MFRFHKLLSRYQTFKESFYCRTWRGRRLYGWVQLWTSGKLARKELELRWKSCGRPRPTSWFSWCARGEVAATWKSWGRLVGVRFLPWFFGISLGAPIGATYGPLKGLLIVLSIRTMVAFGLEFTGKCKYFGDLPELCWTRQGKMFSAPVF